jgi:hypothetical protein
VLAASGLLSVLSGQEEVFFFNVTNPEEPTLIAAADLPLSGCADEFRQAPGGGFLVGGWVGERQGGRAFCAMPACGSGSGSGSGSGNAAIAAHTAWAAAPPSRLPPLPRSLPAWPGLAGDNDVRRRRHVTWQGGQV